VLGGLVVGLPQAALIQTQIPQVLDLWIVAFDVPAVLAGYNMAQWSQVGIYAIAAIILLWRPQGLLGEEVSTT
jgi:branched-chain amino acid transport system permease protein